MVATETGHRPGTARILPDLQNFNGVCDLVTAMVDVIGRTVLFAAAHLVAGACCILIAYGAADAGGAEPVQPRYSTHPVAPFVPGDAGVQGRFHAGMCDDYAPWGANSTALYVPGTDASGAPVPPADVADSGGYYNDQGFAYEVEPLPGVLAYRDFPTQSPLPPFAYGPCYNEEPVFIDK